MGAFPCSRPLVDMGNFSTSGVWEQLSHLLSSFQARLALIRGVSCNFYQNQCKVLKEQLLFAEEISNQRCTSTSLLSSANLLWPHSAITELRRLLKIGNTLIQECQDESCLKAYLRQGERTQAFEEALKEVVWCMSVVLYYNSIKGSLPENPELMSKDQFPFVKLGAYKELHMLQKAALADQAELLATLNLWIQNHVCSADECGGQPPLCVAGQILRRAADSSEMDHTSVFCNINSDVLGNSGAFIGGGGFSSVVETKWLGDTYARKIFQLHSPEVFTNEANALSKLRHRHMVSVLAYSLNSQTCSLIMERMPYDLRKYMDYRRTLGVNPPFSFSAAVDLMLQVAEAIQYMHSQGMVHRDVKPANILVKEVDHDPLLRKEGFVVAKLTDFGLAKSKREITSYSHLTKNQGTKRWMAPEVFGADADNEDHPLVAYPFKTDVYSFGIVCFEVLTGMIPFPDVKLGELYKLITDLDKPLRPELPESCPEFLASLIHQCWHTDPEERPPFTEICGILRHLKALLMLSISTDSQIHRSQLFLRDSPGDGQLQHKMEIIKSRTTQMVRHKQASNSGSVFYTTFDGSSWTTAVPLPKGMPIPNELSLVEHRGTLVAIHRRCTDSLAWQTYTGSSWTQSEIIHDRISSLSIAGSRPAVVTFKGRLYCAYCAEDNHVRLTWSDDSKVWSEGTRIGGSAQRTLDRPALVSYGDLLITVIRGLDNRIYWARSSDPSNASTWSAYSSIYNGHTASWRTINILGGRGGAQLVVCNSELYCFVDAEDKITGAPCRCWCRITELKNKPGGTAFSTRFSRIQYASDANAGWWPSNFTCFKNNIVCIVYLEGNQLGFGIASISEIPNSELEVLALELEMPEPELELVLESELEMVPKSELELVATTKLEVMSIGTTTLPTHRSQGEVSLCVIDSKLICVYVGGPDK